jgi:hypothetical protein
MMVSHYQGLYRRARAGERSGGYTRDFLQGPAPISSALRKMFRGAPPPYEELTYHWPGGSFPGGRIYRAADYDRNGRVDVGQWTGRGAPHPWRLGDPASDPLITLEGSLEPDIPTGANEQWKRLAEQRPWLMMVQLDWSRTDLHLRAYLGDPPPGRAEAGIDHVPASLRALMKGRGGAVLGERLPDLWFEPADLRDPWQLAPVDEHTTAAVAEPVEPAIVSGPLGQRYRAANENARRKRVEPFEVDPDQLDRATQLHAATQNALSAVARDRGREPLSPIGEPNYDLAWEEPDGSVVVVEVKSIRWTNAERQLRLGLGQVLRYRSLLEADGHKVKSVLALSGPPHDPRWIALCDQLDVSLIWMPNLDTMLTQALST